MGLTTEERQILVLREFEKARIFYNQAEANLSIGIWDVVANRLYYSVFHAVSALLINDEHKVGTHKGASLTFGLHYVKTGIFSAPEARLYAQLQTLREKADYNCNWEAEEDDVRPMMPLALNFLQKVDNYLHRES